MHTCQEYDQSVVKIFYIQVTVELDEHVDIEHINSHKLNSPAFRIFLLNLMQSPFNFL